MAGDDSGTPRNKELAANDLIYRLARPSAIDASWVKPGKVSWEWWNAWNLEGVGFKTGINDEDYRILMTLQPGTD